MPNASLTDSGAELDRSRRARRDRDFLRFGSRGNEVSGWEKQSVQLELVWSVSYLLQGPVAPSVSVLGLSLSARQQIRTNSF